MTLFAEGLLGGAVLATAGGWLYWRRQARKLSPALRARAGSKRGEGSARSFQAVTIVPKSGACKVARGKVGHRFLAQEAPPLPLPGCDRKRCVCHYEFHEDRREPGDRRAPIMNQIGETLIATGKWRERRPDRRRLR